MQPVAQYQVVDREPRRDTTPGFTGGLARCNALAVHTGLRQGELLGLRWRDVDLKAGWLEVSASLTRGGLRRPPKTPHSRRRVKLSDTAKRTLSAHRLRMAERLLPMRARADGDTLVFVDPKGDPFNGAHITERALKPLLRREGLREIRFHDLRHAFASLMLSQGARVDLVSQMLGPLFAGAHPVDLRAPHARRSGVRRAPAGSAAGRCRMKVHPRHSVRIVCIPSRTGEFWCSGGGIGTAYRIPGKTSHVSQPRSPSAKKRRMRHMRQDP